MKGLKTALLLTATSFGLVACSGDSYIGDLPLNPANAEEVSKNLTPQIGSSLARKLVGDLPTATVNAETLSVGLSGSAEDQVNNGNVLTKELVVDSNEPVQSILLKVVGASDFFEFVVASDAKLSSSFNLQLPIPSNFTSGRFCLIFAARTVSNQVSPASRQQCVRVLSSLAAAPTQQPSATASAAPTAAPTATPASTPPPVATATPTPVATAVPSSPPATPTPTVAPSATPTAQPSAAPSATPTPAPTATPSTAGSAAACFNADLFTQGTRIVQTYKSTTSDGTVDFTDDRTVNGPATFDGQQTIETTGTTTSTATGSGTTTSDTSTYSKVDGSVPQAETVGTATTSSTQFGDVQTESVFNPPRVDRYDLNPGESQDQNYTVATTTNSFGQTISSETANDVTRTYVGRSTVSVPAGTYETCRFDESGTSTTSVSGQTSSGSTNTTNYFEVGSGLLIKSVSGDTTTELIEATINGVLVR